VATNEIYNAPTSEELEITLAR